MRHFMRTFFISFFWYLFFVVLGGAAVMVVAIPPVGNYVASALCEGTVESETVNYSLPGEQRVKVNYTCIDSAGVQTPVSDTQLLIYAGVRYLVFATLIVWPLLFLLIYWFGGRKRQQASPGTVFVIHSSGK